MVFMPSHLLCTFAIGRQTALVVDIGYKETEILPVSYWGWEYASEGKVGSILATVTAMQQKT